MIPIPIVLPLSAGGSLIGVLPEPYKTIIFATLSTILFVLSSVFIYILIQQLTHSFKEFIKHWKERRENKMEIENRLRLQTKLMNHMYKINKEIEIEEKKNEGLL